jgi:hypothetical protein
MSIFHKKKAYAPERQKPHVPPNLLSFVYFIKLSMTLSNLSVWHDVLSCLRTRVWNFLDGWMGTCSEERPWHDLHDLAW